MQPELIAALQGANREIKGLVSRLSEDGPEPNRTDLRPGELQAVSRKIARIAKLFGRASRAQPQAPFAPIPQKARPGLTEAQEFSPLRTEAHLRDSASSGEALRGGNDAQLQQAIEEYVANLEPLKSVLGKAQDSLRERRNQLEKDLKRLNSTRAWVETFRSINQT
jgi:hypothetical protein